MTQRQAKRPYGGPELDISSYFPHNASLQQPSYSLSNNLSIDITPSLPHTVQTNLLSVGMRVRKSVPEGYKTGTEYPGFNRIHESKSLPCTPTIKTSPHTTPKTRPRANAGARELLPFCGLLKMGGMNAQQAWGVYSPTQERSWSRYDCHNVDSMVPDEDDVPVLSQGSVAGTPVGNKRRCEWDDSGDDEEMEVKTSVSYVFGDRPMAVPRRRTNQGKREVTRVFGEDMDFGEAEFLDFGLKGVEVEMGGV